ncbi:MAG: HAMP domain-containing sensor histidine kinase [Desulfoprunum sp.]|nr:HAMP domain-containing sensor histidine kinase [Desulfoprunum sp.]
MSGVVEFLGQRLSRIRVKWLRFRSIKGKILIIFAVTFLSISALTVMNFWNLSTLKTRMVLSESYDDLLNNILELRRFEKNFLIYHDNQSIIESKDYLERIDALVGDLSEDLPELDGRPSFIDFQTTLLDYRKLVNRITEGDRAAPEILRNLGKKLTDAADRFREVKRARIHATIARTSILPFAFFAILLFLMALVLWLISQGLLKPLDVVMETTRLVGRGDFRPINYDGVRLEEISGLIEAFNRMAEELETNQEDLIQARKIAAIGTFTAGIAHELNNPINNIALTAESFKEEYGQRMDGSCTEMIDDILSQAERAADIVKNLLDFSRTENPVLTKIAPEQILTSTIALVKNQFKMVGLHLETSVSRSLPLIRGNMGNLQQVFTNLLLNAIQATPQGGRIGMHVARAQIPGYISFTIEDTGPGIPEEIQHKIFEPFFSTKEVGKGTGLGLAVSYAIIKRHGGRIEVFSETGQGARFTVLLPHVPEEKNRDFIGWTAS